MTAARLGPCPSLSLLEIRKLGQFSDSMDVLRIRIKFQKLQESSDNFKKNWKIREVIRSLKKIKKFEIYWHTSVPQARRWKWWSKFSFWYMHTMFLRLTCIYHSFLIHYHFSNSENCRKILTSRSTDFENQRSFENFKEARTTSTNWRSFREYGCSGERHCRMHP